MKKKEIKEFFKFLALGDVIHMKSPRVDYDKEIIVKIDSNRIYVYNLAYKKIKSFYKKVALSAILPSSESWELKKISK